MPRLVATAVALGIFAASPARAAELSGVWLTNTGDAQIRRAHNGTGMCGTII